MAIAIMCMASLWTQPLQAEPKEENCEDGKSTADIVECVAIQAAVWERRLNAAYQKLMEDLPARRRDRLRSAQRLGSNSAMQTVPILPVATGPSRVSTPGSACCA
jgi:uncharacterized protein YecT (DUF1311 family)